MECASTFDDGLEQVLYGTEGALEGCPMVHDRFPTNTLADGGRGVSPGAVSDGSFQASM